MDDEPAPTNVWLVAAGSGCTKKLHAAAYALSSLGTVEKPFVETVVAGRTHHTRGLELGNTRPIHFVSDAISRGAMHWGYTGVRAGRTDLISWF